MILDMTKYPTGRWCCKVFERETVVWLLARSSWRWQFSLVSAVFYRFSYVELACLPCLLSASFNLVKDGVDTLSKIVVAFLSKSLNICVVWIIR